MCKFFLEGACSRAGRCSFAHGDDELHSSSQPSSKMCKTLIATGRCKNPECRYAHSKDDLTNMSAAMANAMPTEGWPWNGITAGDARDAFSRAGFPFLQAAGATPLGVLGSVPAGQAESQFSTESAFKEPASSEPAPLQPVQPSAAQLEEQASGRWLGFLNPLYSRVTAAGAAALQSCPMRSGRSPAPGMGDSPDGSRADESVARGAKELAEPIGYLGGLMPPWLAACNEQRVVVKNTFIEVVFPSPSSGRCARRSCSVPARSDDRSRRPASTFEAVWALAVAPAPRGDVRSTLDVAAGTLNSAASKVGQALACGKKPRGPLGGQKHTKGGGIAVEARSPSSLGGTDVQEVANFELSAIAEASSIESSKDVVCGAEDPSVPAPGCKTLASAPPTVEGKASSNIEGFGSSQLPRGASGLEPGGGKMPGQAVASMAQRHATGRGACRGKRPFSCRRLGVSSIAMSPGERKAIVRVDGCGAAMARCSSSRSQPARNSDLLSRAFPPDPPPAHGPLQSLYPKVGPHPWHQMPRA